MSQTSATIVGNVTGDPSLKFVGNDGRAVVNFSVAHTPRRNNNGTWEDMDPEFYDVAAWGTLAEHVADSFAKGDRVIVSGRLKFDKWQADDGTNRSKISVVADYAGHELTWATSVATKATKGGGGKPRAAAARDTNPFEEETF